MKLQAASLFTGMANAAQAKNNVQGQQQNNVTFKANNAMKNDDAVEFRNEFKGNALNQLA